jgi:hypothetical protein
MLLQNLIECIIRQVTFGIEHLNSNAKSYKARLPDQIEVETYVVKDGDNIKISDNTGTKIKLVIPLTSYWVSPKDKE